MKVTAEMKLALDMLRATGHATLTTRERKLDCGCLVRCGFRTDTYDVFGAIGACDDHVEEAADVIAHAHDEDVMAEVGTMPLPDSLVHLLERRIAAVPS